MDYTDSGFNKFLTRRLPTESDQILEDEASLKIQQVMGSQFNYGVFQSIDGRVIVDWNNRQIIVKDGFRNRVIMGDLDKLGTYGIRVINPDGTTHFEESA